MMATHHADVVGSLLAPSELAEVQSYTPAREVSAEELKDLQDRAIDDALAMQERAGLVTTKRPALEDRERLRARIEEAARFHPREQLGISTQCGFESGTHAPLDAAQQEAKLTLVAEVGREVWVKERA